MPEGTWRWAVPPLPVDAGPDERREHRRSEIASQSEIRWRWVEVCSGTGLIRRVVPTGTVSFEPPRLGPITLGPPTRLSVALRPGQLPSDLSAIRERLAAAFDVDDVEVRRLAPGGWVTVELVEDGAGVPGDEIRPQPPDPDSPGAAPSRRHFPRRRRRGPFGGPRSRP